MKNVREGIATTLLTAGLALVAFAPSPARAQEQFDARWMPWLGCWESDQAPADETLLCFRPQGAGVELLTIEDGAVATRETLRADGIGRAVEEEGCSGEETVAFSSDSRRIYLHSNQTCEGGTERSASGIIAMISPDQWLDVKSVDVAGEKMGWVRGYRTAPAARLADLDLGDLTGGRDLAVRSARVSAARAPDVESVIEASASVGPEAVKTWVAEANEPFDLDSHQLIRLADGGVSPDVIDVMVAVTYPDKFDIGTDADVGMRSRSGVRRGVLGVGDDYYGTRSRYRGLNPFFWDPFYSLYGYGYSPYGYGYGGYGGYYGGYYGGGYYGGYRPTVVIVEPRDDAGGRAIWGRGYTRSGSSGSTGRSATPRGSTPRSTSQGQAGKASSSPPASTGRSGSSTGRTAKRRGGGGGGL